MGSSISQQVNTSSGLRYSTTTPYNYSPLGGFTLIIHDSIHPSNFIVFPSLIALQILYSAPGKLWNSNQPKPRSFSSSNNIIRAHDGIAIRTSPDDIIRSEEYICVVSTKDGYPKMTHFYGDTVVGCYPIPTSMAATILGGRDHHRNLYRGESSYDHLSLEFLDHCYICSRNNKQMSDSSIHIRELNIRDWLIQGLVLREMGSSISQQVNTSSGLRYSTTTPYNYSPLGGFTLIIHDSIHPSNFIVFPSPIALQILYSAPGKLWNSNQPKPRSFSSSNNIIRAHDGIAIRTSPDDIIRSEEYTCVVSTKDGYPKMTHFYGDTVVGCHPIPTSMAATILGGRDHHRNLYRSESSYDHLSLEFLDHCYICSRNNKQMSDSSIHISKEFNNYESKQIKIKKTKNQKA